MPALIPAIKSLYSRAAKPVAGVSCGGAAKLPPPYKYAKTQLNTRVLRAFTSALPPSRLRGLGVPLCVVAGSDAG